LREEYQQTGRLVQVFGFTSDRKMASVIVAPESGGTGGKQRHMLYNKGAADWVLARCTSFFDESGALVPLRDPERQSFERMINEMASQGLRTLCLTQKEIDASELPFKEAPEFGLSLIAIVGIKDPVRPEVPEAVRYVLVCPRPRPRWVVFLRLVPLHRLTRRKPPSTTPGRAKTRASRCGWSRATTSTRPSTSLGSVAS